MFQNRSINRLPRIVRTLLVIVLFVFGLNMIMCSSTSSSSIELVRSLVPTPRQASNESIIVSLRLGEKVVGNVSPQPPDTPPHVYYRVQLPVNKYLDVAATVRYGPATMYIKIDDGPTSSDFDYKLAMSNLQKEMKHEYYRNGKDETQEYYIGFLGDAEYTFIVKIVDSPVNSGEVSGLIAGLIISLILLALAVIAIIAGGIVWYRQRKNYASARMV
ncbi:hypothetical protein C9374_014659 [Naegleria lovaniensis]|uniref:Uncharacterized protein n=1 Tax=Naegleria lovaniensis TaxID=51637 RepID=A0AA88KPL8_NAELO|nr:uncharacterized protein C9374_014659 [Naegleria lovaniensis]KAG2389259.1 hypothetical protein C9374_014659 [Naegleria lovaniensis]